MQDPPFERTQPPRKPSRHRSTLALCALLLGIPTVLVIYSPELYRAFCSLTGYGGSVKRATVIAPKAVTDQDITIYFDANVAPGLPWEFHPEKRKVVTHIGEPTRINYMARNNSAKTIVARAVFNVTPYKAAQYFFKIQCFCFTNEKLRPGESAVMPVVLYVDKQILKDKNASDVNEITLSYTFYPQDDLSPREVADARDLSKGSRETAARLARQKTAGFDNDAPRK